MGKTDTAMQSYLGDKRRFADLFNGVFFQGKTVINACDLQEASERYADAEGQGASRFRDIKMFLNTGGCLRILAVENQLNIDYTMPYRCMQYDSMEYGKQLKELKARNREQKKLQTAAERLCGMTREDRLVPVYTLCLYHGEEPWNGPLSLGDMMDFGDDSQGIRQYFADYPLRLFCVNEAESFDMFHTELRELFGAMKYRRDKKRLRELLTRDEAYSRMSADTVRTLSILLNIPWLWAKRRRYMSKKEHKEEYDMCQAIREWREDDKAEGRAEGRAEAQKTFVLNMLKKGFSDEEICELTECTPDFIDRLR